MHCPGLKSASNSNATDVLRIGRKIFFRNEVEAAKKFIKLIAQNSSVKSNIVQCAQIKNDYFASTSISCYN